MANKRQRLAKRHHAEERAGSPQNPAEPAVSASKSQAFLKPSVRKIFKKHPLRVSGSKPGDGCFICNSDQHIARACPQKFSKERKMICLLCRKLGHTLKSCPTKADRLDKKCYNCGNSGHRLAECKEALKDGGTAFASCFLCKETGHLSKNCPTNTHGIYPKGGSCKICGGVTHLAKDCPNKDCNTRPNSIRQKISISKEVAPTSISHAKRIVFTSGDDLEDDFVEGEGDKSEGRKDGGSLKPKGRAPERKANQRETFSLKPLVEKAKKNPKIVNF